MLMMKTLSVGLPTTHLLLVRVRQHWPQLVRVFESAIVAYPLLLLLQLKVIWGLWTNRDITVGDTTSYYLDAWRWFTNGEVNIVWSPLYTAFYGSFLHLNPDVVWATFAHRVVIVLVVSGLVLAVFRQLLPPSIAWLCAAWWAILPIVFNTLYEVHLFSVIPVLISWLFILTSQGPWRRAAGWGMLGVSVVLVRNELSVPFGLLSLVLAGYEVRRLQQRISTDPHSLGSTLLAYGTVLVLAAAIVIGVYHKSYMKYPAITEHLKGKHTVNMAQVYSFGYQQRHPEWTHSPWVEYHGLMQKQFGQPLLTLREMLEANPKEVAEHFAWNWSLTPSGLQLLLFNRASGSVNPDYDQDALRRLNSSLALGLSLAVLLIWVVGLTSLWRTRKLWLHQVSSGRVLGWLAMLAVAAVVPLIIMTQRPRPSYLFSFSILLMATTGLSVWTLAARWNLMISLRAVLPILMLGLLVVVPRFYNKAYGAGHPQVVARVVHRLAAQRQELIQSGKHLAVPYSLAAWYAFPMAQFGGHPEDQRLFETAWLLSKLRDHETLVAGLDRFAVDYVYLDEWTLQQIEARQLDPEGDFVAARESTAWRLLDAGYQPGDRWRLYARVQR
jgi:hypothetical protein